MMKGSNVVTNCTYPWYFYTLTVLNKPFFDRNSDKLAFQPIKHFIDIFIILFQKSRIPRMAS